MAKRSAHTENCHVDSLPPLPLDDAHWQAIFDFLGLSPKQSEVATLLLRSAARKQIADALEISEGTLKTHLYRIFARTRTSDPMEFAMRVLAVSHHIHDDKRCTPNG